MRDDCFLAARSRVVVEGDQVLPHNVSVGPLNLVFLANVRNTELALRHPRKSTFAPKSARFSKFENVPEVSHPVSAVMGLSGLIVF